KELEINTLIFVPNACPETKKTAIKRRGGEFVELIVTDGDYDFAEHSAYEHADKNRMTYVSSFEDPTVISGQGTAGFEMFTDEPDIELLLIPAGGGGLMNGIAIAAKALNPDVEIWGVQSVASNPWVVSWPDGIVKEVTYLDTLADGLAGYIPQSLLSLAKKRVTGILEITEDDIAKAIAFLHREHHQVVEGAGAVGVAALLAGKIDPKKRKTGIVVSGGNIDEEKLKMILSVY
ncbi:MAG: pyridoxal-phosphate dependent enzyme, partial [Synergistaceae bacterium]|nr:pyridoxal-phosphate dependent enzyme [Synergistaceae bacterium]